MHSELDSLCRDTDAEDEEQMILGRLATIQEFRQETYRLESEGQTALACRRLISTLWVLEKTCGRDFSYHKAPQ